MNARLRLLAIACLSLGGIGAAHAQNSGWVGQYGRLLEKYATPAGVKYAEWKNNAADMQALRGVVEAIGSENVSGLGKNEQLAFYVNAYNAWILHEALEKYPTKSVKDTLFTFFTSKRIKVAGQQTSFKRLEDDIIRAKFDEPRIHVALNCASASCPPLLAEPFRADRLDAQFDRMARGFVNSERGVRISGGGKTAELSQIFEWYKDDFKNGGPIAFINKYRSKPLPSDVQISYQKYDWSLNEAK
jgi:hypothetical protein